MVLEYQRAKLFDPPERRPCAVTSFGDYYRYSTPLARGLLYYVRTGYDRDVVSAMNAVSHKPNSILAGTTTGWPLQRVQPFSCAPPIIPVADRADFLDRPRKTALANQEWRLLIGADYPNNPP